MWEICDFEETTQLWTYLDKIMWGLLTSWNVMGSNYFIVSQFCLSLSHQHFLHSFITQIFALLTYIIYISVHIWYVHDILNIIYNTHTQIILLNYNNDILILTKIIGNYSHLFKFLVLSVSIHVYIYVLCILKIGTTNQTLKKERYVSYPNPMHSILGT